MRVDAARHVQGPPLEPPLEDSDEDEVPAATERRGSTLTTAGRQSLSEKARQAPRDSVSGRFRPRDDSDDSAPRRTSRKRLISDGSDDSAAGQPSAKSMRLD